MHINLPGVVGFDKRSPLLLVMCSILRACHLKPHYSIVLTKGLIAIVFMLNNSKKSSNMNAYAPQRLTQV